jgi:hypothetical protein
MYTKITLHIILRVSNLSQFLMRISERGISIRNVRLMAIPTVENTVMIATFIK